jgi:hypothetical protein
MSLVLKFERLADQTRALLQVPGFYLPAIAICLTSLVFLRGLGADPDLFARIAMGYLTNQLGTVPLTDPFAYSPKKELWIDHEWLSGVVFFYLARWGQESVIGADAALFFFKLVLVFFSIYLISRAQLLQNSNHVFAFFLLLLVVFDCSYLWVSTVRAQIFTYFFLPLFLLAFVEFKKRRATALFYLLPPAMFIWANSHGGFVVGLGLFGIFALFILSEETIKSGLHQAIKRNLVPAMSFLFCIVVTFTNPYGASYWAYILEAVTMPRPYITEWERFDLFSLSSFITVSLGLAFVISFFSNRRAVSLLGLIFVVVAAFYGLKHARLAAIFSIVVVIFGTDAISSLIHRFEQKFSHFSLKLKRAGAFLLVSALPFMLFHIIVTFIPPGKFSLDYTFYPVKAIEWLRQQGGGKLLVDFNRGSFALWRGYPDILVAIDGRYEEVYPDETYRAAGIAFLPGHPEHRVALEKLWPDYILLEVHSYAYLNSLEFGPEWKTVYKDESFSILGQVEQHPGPIDLNPTLHTPPIWQPLYRLKQQ